MLNYGNGLDAYLARIDTYALSSATIERPTQPEYDHGVDPFYTLPAKWFNWLHQNETYGLNQMSICLDDLYAEMNSILQAASIVPDKNNNHQILDAIQLLITQYAATLDFFQQAKLYTDSQVALEAIIRQNQDTSHLNQAKAYADALLSSGLGNVPFTPDTSFNDILTGTSLSAILGHIAYWPYTWAPKAHASDTTTYGIATQNLYGHAMFGNVIPPQATDATGAIGTDNAKYAAADHKHPGTAVTLDLYTSGSSTLYENLVLTTVVIGSRMNIVGSGHLKAGTGGVIAVGGIRDGDWTGAFLGCVAVGGKNDVQLMVHRKAPVTQFTSSVTDRNEYAIPMQSSDIRGIYIVYSEYDTVNSTSPSYVKSFSSIIVAQIAFVNNTLKHTVALSVSNAYNMSGGGTVDGISFTGVICEGIGGVTLSHLTLTSISSSVTTYNFTTLEVSGSLINKKYDYRDKNILTKEMLTVSNSLACPILVPLADMSLYGGFLSTSRSFGNACLYSYGVIGDYAENFIEYSTPLLGTNNMNWPPSSGMEINTSGITRYDLSTNPNILGLSCLYSPAGNVVIATNRGVRASVIASPVSGLFNSKFSVALLDPSNLATVITSLTAYSGSDLYGLIRYDFCGDYYYTLTAMSSASSSYSATQRKMYLPQKYLLNEQVSTDPIITSLYLSRINVITKTLTTLSSPNLAAYTSLGYTRILDFTVVKDSFYILYSFCGMPLSPTDGISCIMSATVAASYAVMLPMYGSNDFYYIGNSTEYTAFYSTTTGNVLSVNSFSVSANSRPNISINADDTITFTWVTGSAKNSMTIRTYTKNGAYTDVTLAAGTISGYTVNRYHPTSYYRSTNLDWRIVAFTRTSATNLVIDIAVLPGSSNVPNTVITTHSIPLASQVEVSRSYITEDGLQLFVIITSLSDTDAYILQHYRRSLTTDSFVLTQEESFVNCPNTTTCVYELKFFPDCSILYISAQNNDNTDGNARKITLIIYIDIADTFNILYRYSYNSESDLFHVCSIAGDCFITDGRTPYEKLLHVSGAYRVASDAAVYSSNAFDSWNTIGKFASSPYIFKLNLNTLVADPIFLPYGIFEYFLRGSTSVAYTWSRDCTKLFVSLLAQSNISKHLILNVRSITDPQIPMVIHYPGTTSSLSLNHTPVYAPLSLVDKILDDWHGVLWPKSICYEAERDYLTISCACGNDKIVLLELSNEGGAVTKVGTTKASLQSSQDLTGKEVIFAGSDGSGVTWTVQDA